MITLSNISTITIDDIIGVTPNKVVDDRKYFVLLDAVKIKLSNGDKIIIPKGYRFNGSSAPRFLWWLFPTYGAFLFASLIHDYLYEVTAYSRKFSDKEMKIWSKETYFNTLGEKFDTTSRYYGVRLLGKKHYGSN